MSPLDYLYGRLNYERVSPAVQKGAFRLQRMRHLLPLLHHPERSYQIIHIGGTKGKGSTCAMVSAMLVEGGRQVGLYTSPHLEKLEERFRVNGQSCTESELFELIESVREAADSLEQLGDGPPTFFELTTAMALVHFNRRGCELAVIEVGLGGRLDSTNVCDPVVSVLTSIGLDHQHILGDTEEKIAFEKAGIIKPGVPVISGFRHAGAAQVVRDVAKQRAAPLWEIGKDFDHADPEIPSFEYPNAFDFLANSPNLVSRLGWRIGLEGAHQRHNAAVAVAVMDVLSPIGLAPSLEDQRQGLENVACTGRIQRFRGKPETILDTAHNVDSIKALRSVLLNRPADGKTVVVFGTSADKDAQSMLAILTELADSLILTRYWSNPRWFDPHALAQMTSHAHQFIELNPSHAYRLARDIAPENGRIVICGSFFLAAELLPTLRANYAN